MNVTATDAKNRFGQVLEQAQRQPVVIEKAGRPHSVVLSVEQYEALLQARQRGPAANAGKRFYAQYKEWVDEQNQRFEKYGLWNDEFRRW